MVATCGKCARNVSSCCCMRSMVSSSCRSGSSKLHFHKKILRRTAQQSTGIIYNAFILIDVLERSVWKQKYRKNNLNILFIQHSRGGSVMRSCKKNYKKICRVIFKSLILSSITQICFYKYPMRTFNHIYAVKPSSKMMHCRMYCIQFSVSGRS